MNNKTMKKIDITIKLRGDNVYDLYVDDKWVASRGSYINISEEVKKEVEKCIMNIGDKYGTENKCVCCGEIIPEGRQVCVKCESKYV